MVFMEGYFFATLALVLVPLAFTICIIDYTNTEYKSKYPFFHWIHEKFCDHEFELIYHHKGSNGVVVGFTQGSYKRYKCKKCQLIREYADYDN